MYGVNRVVYRQELAAIHNEIIGCTLQFRDLLL